MKMHSSLLNSNLVEEIAKHMNYMNTLKRCKCSNGDSYDSNTSNWLKLK